MSRVLKWNPIKTDDKIGNGKVVLFKEDPITKQAAVWTLEKELVKPEREIVIVPTGAIVPDSYIHLDSYSYGSLVWHLFEVVDDRSNNKTSGNTTGAGSDNN